MNLVGFIFDEDIPIKGPRTSNKFIFEELPTFVQDMVSRMRKIFVYVNFR